MNEVDGPGENFMAVETLKAELRKAGEICKEDGALVECIGDDMPFGKLTSFLARVGEGGQGRDFLLDHLPVLRPSAMRSTRRSRGSPVEGR